MKNKKDLWYNLVNNYLNQEKEYTTSSIKNKCVLTVQRSNFNKHREYVEDFIEQNPDCLHLPPRWLLERFLKFLHDGELMNGAF
jgi:hypothetical protein